MFYNLNLSTQKFILLLLIILLLIYFIFITSPTGKFDKEKNNLYKLASNRNYFVINETSPVDYNLWLIFTKVNNNSPLKYKFHNLIVNLVNISSVPLIFHVIVDDSSINIALAEFSYISKQRNKSINYHFHNFTKAATLMNDIVLAMTPHFSSNPGTYYSDALFYLSLGLYRLAPENQDKAIMLDCDLYFKEDAALLFQEFNNFKATALFGLAPELTPVYRHILHKYKKTHKTTFGEFYHSANLSTDKHPLGYQGYNSGVLLLNLSAIRKSEKFFDLVKAEKVNELTEKYGFRGHLGDQDFYTLVGFEYPELIHTMNCGFNRQLCTWWRDHGYSDVFGDYSKCKHKIVVLHGNCNTPLPK